MITSTNYVSLDGNDDHTDPTTQTGFWCRWRFELREFGTLQVYESWHGSTLVAEAFTLTSLADCMGLPISTVDGRYKRGRLTRFKVDIPINLGRPLRGFPYAYLGVVEAVIANPGVAVKEVGGVVSFTTPDRPGRKPAPIAPLEPTYFVGKPYYTMVSLARGLGLSHTTVRKKLKEAGMMRLFVDLGTPPQGGRPKRGIPERFLGQIKLVVDEGHSFRTALERAQAKLAGATQAAQAQMVQQIVPHERPGPLQAYDPVARMPVTRVPSRNQSVAVDELADMMQAIAEEQDRQAIHNPPHTIGPLAEEPVDAYGFVLEPGQREPEAHLTLDEIIARDLAAAAANPHG